MNLAIYETAIHGHRGAYLTEITAEAVRRGWAVTVVTPSNDRGSPYFSQLRDLVGAPNLVFTPFMILMPERISAASMLRYQFRQWRAARQSLVTNYRPWDFVYIPNIDYMDKAIQVLGAPSHPVPMGGMMMRVRFHLKQLGVETHRSLFPSLASLSFAGLLGARSLAAVTTADPTLVKYCEGKRQSKYRKVTYVPEIGMVAPRRDSATAKKEFGFRPESRVILIYGSIEVRKAFTELIEAIAGAESIPSIRILIVGQPDQAARETLESTKYEELRRKGVLATRLGFADTETQDLAFAAADVVWVAYRNHSTMSGVFSQAMSCSLPVIGPNYGLLSWLVSEYKVGICVDINNPREIGSRIVEMLQNAESMEAFRRKAAQISLSHLPRSFAGAVCDAIAAGRGGRARPESSALRTPAAL